MPDPDGETLQALRGLWVALAGLYGAERWSRSYGDSPEREPGSGRLTMTGQQWAATLAGLSRQQIRAGVRATRFAHSPWLPSAPEFRARCLGIPRFATVQAAFTAPDTMSRTDAAFCRAVWQRVDGYRLRQASQRDAQQMLRDAYDATCDAVMRGEPLPAAPAAALRQDKPPPKTEAKPETVEAELARVREVLGDWTVPADPEPGNGPLDPGDPLDVEASP